MTAPDPAFIPLAAVGFVALDVFLQRRLSNAVQSYRIESIDIARRLVLRAEVPHSVRISAVLQLNRAFGSFWSLLAVLFVVPFAAIVCLVSTNFRESLTSDDDCPDASSREDRDRLSLLSLYISFGNHPVLMVFIVVAITVLLLPAMLIGSALKGNAPGIGLERGLEKVIGFSPFGARDRIEQNGWVIGGIA